VIIYNSSLFSLSFHIAFSFIGFYLFFERRNQKPMEGKVGLFREYVNGFQIPSHKQSVASSQEDRDCLLEFGCAIGYYVVTPSDGWEKKIS